MTTENIFEPFDVHGQYAGSDDFVHVEVPNDIDLKTFISGYVTTLKMLAATGDRIFIFVNSGKSAQLAFRYTRDTLKQRVLMFLAEKESMPSKTEIKNVLRVKLASHDDVVEFLRCLRTGVVSCGNKYSQCQPERFNRKFCANYWNNK